MSQVAVGDFNGDGKLDLAVTSYDGEVTILLGNGDGTFKAGPTLHASSSCCVTIAIVAGDFNNDGKVDLAVADPSTGTTSIWLGNGDGTFTATTATLATGEPDNLAVGDFNGDGNLDLAVSNKSLNSVTIWLGNGNGTFTTQKPSQIPFTVPTGGVFGLAAADFNGDGKLDLALTNYFPQNAAANAAPSTVTILFGNGDGTFKTGPTSPAGLNPFHVTAGDFNHDGKADLAVTNDTGDTVSILLGNGDGTFTASVPVAAAALGSIAAGDFNGDGWPDLAMSSSTSSNVSIFLNLGVTPFVKITPTITWPSPTPITYGTTLSGNQLNATSGGIAGSFVYTPAAGTVPALGTDLLSVTFTPTDTLHYTTASATVTLTVNPAPPSYTLAAAQSSTTGSATINLTLVSTNYAGTVSFATSVSSANGTASNVSASAPSVALTSGGNGSTVLIITANASAANHAPVSPWSGRIVVFGAVLLGVPFSLRRKRTLAILLTAAAILLAGFSMACNGGGTTAAPRIYTVTVTPTGTGAVVNPSPVTITVTVQ
ncbi:MAG: VCBS repeat-containing protein [Candidatus Korobacteraceae bacterium]